MTQANLPAKTPADVYEEFFVPGIFGPLSGRVLGAAAIRRGQRVLDLACGTGILARQAAPSVGTSGKVIGLDLRPGMLAVARTRPAPAGASVQWLEGDACQLDLDDDTFDVVLCQQGLQFFPNREAALREVKRVSKPGGRLVFALWRAFELHDLFVKLAEVEQRCLAEFGFRLEDVMAPFSLHDADEIVDLFRKTGLGAIEVTTHTVDTSFPSESFVYNMEFAYAAVMPHFVEDAEKFARFVEIVENETKELRDRHTRAGVISFPMHTHIVTARA